MVSSCLQGKSVLKLLVRQKVTLRNWAGIVRNDGQFQIIDTGGKGNKFGTVRITDL